MQREIRKRERAWDRIADNAEKVGEKERARVRSERKLLKMQRKVRDRSGKELRRERERREEGER